MTTALTGVEFRTLVIPDSVDTDDAADFREMVRVRNLVYREISGHDDGSVPADELLPNLKPDQYRLLVMWVVVDHDRFVGRVMLELPQEGESKVAQWRIETLRESWGRGIGSAAYALVEQTAREHGRRILQSWAEHPSAPGPRIAAPTGFGEIPADHAARFFVRHGYTLEQVERNSAFDLTGSFEQVEALLADGTSGIDRLPGRAVVRSYATRVRRGLRLDEVAHDHRRALGRPRVRRGGVGRGAHRAA